MTEVSIEIKSTDLENKSVTTTVAYVNEEADNATLKQFGQQLTALTKNTFISVTKITKEAIA